MITPTSGTRLAASRSKAGGRNRARITRQISNEAFFVPAGISMRPAFVERGRAGVEPNGLKSPDNMRRSKTLGLGRTHHGEELVHLDLEAAAFARERARRR